MKKLLGITLGIMTALGGFVDLGQIVFTMQAGAVFGYRMLWAIVLGTLGIIVYMEMCGRIAVVVGQPVFTIVRKRLGYRLGLLTLIASNLLNLITCAAELGGIYQQIGDELASQYMMAYVSRNARHDGQWRRIVVRTNRPNTLARTKQGYYAPGRS